MVTFIIIFMFDIFISCCKMKNTLCFKKELYVVVVKVRAIVLRKLKHNWQTSNGMESVTLGKIEELDSSWEEGPQYAERLEHFFAANSIAEDEKNVKFF